MQLCVWAVSNIPSMQGQGQVKVWNNKWSVIVRGKCFVGVLKSWVTSVAQPSWPILLAHCKQPRHPALLWLFDLKINYCKFSPLHPTRGSPALHTVFRQRSGKWQSPDFLACNALPLSLKRFYKQHWQSLCSLINLHISIKYLPNIKVLPHLQRLEKWCYIMPPVIYKSPYV